MRRGAPSLLIAARAPAILAVLAGLGAGLLANALATLTCFDTCHPFFSRLDLSSALRLLAPCAVLAALALFLAYCLATRQPQRALIVLLFFLVGGLLGVAALNALLHYARVTLPVTEEGALVEHAVVEWERQWALANLLAAGVWSGGLACLEWGRRWEWLDQRAMS